MNLLLNIHRQIGQERLKGINVYTWSKTLIDYFWLLNFYGRRIFTQFDYFGWLVCELNVNMRKSLDLQMFSLQCVVCLLLILNNCNNWELNQRKNIRKYKFWLQLSGVNMEPFRKHYWGLEAFQFLLAKSGHLPPPLQGLAKSGYPLYICILFFNNTMIYVLLLYLSYFNFLY